MPLAFNQSLAYHNGVWTTLHELAWSVTDLGTTQGAILVERLRTLGGKLHGVDEHLMRLSEGAEKLCIPWPANDISMSELGVELVERNNELVDFEGDVGLVLLLSPGDPGIDRRQTLRPTVMAHLSPLPFGQLAKWYEHGTALHVSRTRNVPAECWSPSIKTRSRLQYYLADRDLAERSDRNSTQNTMMNQPTYRAADSVAVLLSTRGNVTETSISNLIVIGRDGVLRSPPLTDILLGVSLKLVCELAESIGSLIEFTDIAPKELCEADEVLMMGTTGCLWSAVSIDGQVIGNGRTGQVCARLQDAWMKHISFNFIEQASQRSR